ncbi:MAG: sugar phosphate nucleotidyltransferase [Actinomycetota bacterium]
MKALILAGGLGTRLRPLTHTRPKHLLPIANVPHIEHVLDLLQRTGVSEVGLLTSYLASSFAGVVDRERHRGLNLRVAHEEEPLGTAGALRNAASLVAGETFFAFNGDILTNADLSALLAFHRERAAEATIMLRPVEDPSAFGVVPTDESGRVLGFIEKPPPEAAPTNMINAGVYVFESSVLDRIPVGRVWSAERELFPGLVEEGARLYAWATDSYWMDIGTPESFLRANLDALDGRYKSNSIGPPDSRRVLAASRVRVAESARVSSACLGEGCVVEANARVEESVLLPGAVVSESAIVRESILGEGARIAAGARMNGATVGDGEKVEKED